jgi:hypothetical protein
MNIALEDIRNTKWGIEKERVDEKGWNEMHTKLLPLTTVFELLFSCTGGANRKAPMGGCAYGIPRYSETCVAFFAAWPLTVPLEVTTFWPMLL